MKRIWKYQKRRTRDYMRMYIQLADSIINDGTIKERINQARLEKSRKELKKTTRTLPSADFLLHAGKIYTTHRNVGEIERLFIRESSL